MNPAPHNTSSRGSCTESVTIASTKLKAPVRQTPIILEFHICAVDDRALPAPPGARLSDRPAAQAELAKKAQQLERTRKAGGLVDVHSTIGEPSRGHIFCYTCRKLAVDCTCKKPVAADDLANTEPPEIELPYDKARRRLRERMAERRRIRRGIEVFIPCRSSPRAVWRASG